MEPAHVLQGCSAPSWLARCDRSCETEVRDPAHRFDPGIAIAIEDAIVISATDEVILSWGCRSVLPRTGCNSAHRPGVREPAHPRIRSAICSPLAVSVPPWESAHPPDEERDLSAIRGIGPGVRER